MIKISKDLARDILAHMECTDKSCENCHLCRPDCDRNYNDCKLRLRAAIDNADQITTRPERTEISPASPAPVQPGGATKYITITVAEYHFLTKVAAMLEVIANDQAYDHTTVVNAVKTAIKFMATPAEECAAQ